MSEHHRIADVFALGLPAGTEFIVLVYLAHCWNERQAAAWPSVATIAKVLRQSESSARRALHRLEKLGHITAASSRKGGRAKSIRYRLNLPSCGAINPVTAMQGFTPNKPCQTATETLSNGVVNPVIAMTPEPLRTYIKNRNEEVRAPKRAAAQGAAPGAEQEPEPDPARTAQLSTAVAAVGHPEGVAMSNVRSLTSEETRDRVRKLAALPNFGRGDIARTARCTLEQVTAILEDDRDAAVREYEAQHPDDAA